MSDYFVGEIRMFPFSWAPDGWHLCDGTILSIQGNQALFALLGTTYGGNGQTTFGLPDLRGRAMAVQLMTGSIPPYAADYTHGKAGGAESVTLTATQVPPHNHTLNAISATGNAGAPAGNFFSASATSSTVTTPQSLYGPPGAQVSINPGSLSATAAAIGHNNMQPSLVMNFCISMAGIWPPRN